jgi:hypothetical protein
MILRLPHLKYYHWNCQQMLHSSQSLISMSPHQFLYCLLLPFCLRLATFFPLMTVSLLLRFIQTCIPSLHNLIFHFVPNILTLARSWTPFLLHPLPHFLTLLTTPLFRQIFLSLFASDRYPLLKNFIRYRLGSTQSYCGQMYLPIQLGCLILVRRWKVAKKQ